MQFLNGRLSSDDYEDVKRSIRARLSEITKRIFSSAGSGVRDPELGRLKLRRLREPTLNEFPFIHVIPRLNTTRRRLNCFVGHRFLKDIERSLRYNLAHLFEPYRITIRWSGYDLTSSDVFTDIIESIKTSDFCIFDNLGTLNRPNVYIEAGIAYALGRPMILCEYIGKGIGDIPPPADTESVPSDLKGLFRIQYRDYESLCRAIYFNLPMFLQRHSLI